MIVGVAGTNGAGKDTIRTFFEKKGFHHYSLSDVIREELKRKGIPESRQAMGNQADEWRAKDPGYLSKKVLEKAKEPAVVTSIRSEGELAALKEDPRFFFIGVDADVKERYKRISGRSREGDDVSFEQFKEIDEKERTAKGTFQNIDLLLKQADKLFLNNGTQEELFYQLEVFTKENKLIQN